MSKSPLTFIIIVNWNNYPDTIECLNSVLTTSYKNKKIVIIDNSSEDGSLQRLERWAKDNVADWEMLSAPVLTSTIKETFTIISLDKNIGFSGANNVGIRYALGNGADYVLLLNNDTVVTENFLSSMVKTASGIENIGIVGGKIRYFDRNEAIWFNGGYIDFLKGVFYGWDDDCTGKRESGFITGCLMLIPSEVLKKIGYFDERYFLNVEDVDLSCRIKDAGYRLITDCDAVVYHKVSASIGGLYSIRNQYYFHRNRMLFFAERLRGIKKFSFLLFQFSIVTPLWTIIQLFNGRTYIPSLTVKKKEGKILNSLLNGNFVTTPTVIIKKDCFDKAGMFDENLPRLQDWDLFIRIAKYYEFRFINEPLLSSYVQKDSISQDQDALIKALELILKKYLMDFEEAGSSALSRQYYLLGDALCSKGRLANGRSYLLKAFKAYPINIKSLIALFFSLFGKSIYNKFIEFKLSFR